MNWILQRHFSDHFILILREYKNCLRVLMLLIYLFAVVLENTP